ncbi:hypothetical protein E1193_27360 [Micromonospora sp. KC606]|uniref:hypothetical protein n=1 Tax=Micromonospora sp. KC606 TaxID=2530379 RepID=UPI0010477EDF|nr:hypothetical protein [Micromonospora sp. KC606]TDC72603.1 hypothetical protein E1193_27360 [Micromonospora sp. KC606]
MRGRGINYDTGARLANGWTRKAFDSSTVRREMQVIAGDLHCTAVRISGSDPGRLTTAAEHAAEAGLEVWFAPFPCDLTTEQMLPLFADCAARAEDLRRHGADVVLVAGGELSVFARGFLPGDDLFARTALLLTPRPDLRSLLGTVPARINAFLTEVVGTVRAQFGGKVTYASLPFEHVDWSSFDYVAVDAYRAAHNVDTFRQEIRDLHRHGRPVAVTEFGCCTYRGAADRGARGWLIVDRDHEPWRLDGDHQRDEAGQAAYLRDLLHVFEQEKVDSAFWFTFAGYRYPHHPDPRHDLDLASYGVVRLSPDMSWEPKASFHALAAEYRNGSRH